jgi:predicted adenine nucleotide alpha hydrolase (AANH) superfamily ATPase
MEPTCEDQNSPHFTTDFLYVRFIGDRSIDEKDFGKIQKDRVLEMSNWVEQIKNVEEGKERGRRSEVRDAMIAANNHYAGFGPGTVNIFRNMVGMSELSWENQPQIEEQIRHNKRSRQKIIRLITQTFSLVRKSKNDRLVSLNFLGRNRRETQREHEAEQESGN